MFPTLTVAWGTDIDTLDPAQFKSDGSYIVQCNIYDTALQWDAIPVPGQPGLSAAAAGKFLGGIAEIWSFENDGRN